MTDPEILDAEVETLPAVREAQPVNLFGEASPVAVVERATEVAQALAAVIEAQNLYTTIGRKKHVNVEGWTLLGSMLGVFPVVAWSKETEDGWEARVEAVTRNGEVVGAAEAMCTRKEGRWKTADDYAVRSMAQTRAVSKALRHPLGFVMTLAGYEVTPESEMEQANPVTHTQTTDAPPASGRRSTRYVTETGLPIPQSWEDVKELLLAYGDGGETWEMFERFGGAARKLLYGDEGLNPDQKDELWNLSAKAAVALREEVDAAKFPPPSEEDLTKAWASVLDGQELQPVAKKEVPDAP